MYCFPTSSCSILKIQMNNLVIYINTDFNKNEDLMPVISTTSYYGCLLTIPPPSGA